MTQPRKMPTARKAERLRRENLWRRETGFNRRTSFLVLPSPPVFRKSSLPPVWWGKVLPHTSAEQGNKFSPGVFHARIGLGKPDPAGTLPYAHRAIYDLLHES